MEVEVYKRSQYEVIMAVQPVFVLATGTEFSLLSAHHVCQEFKQLN